MNTSPGDVVGWGLCVLVIGTVLAVIVGLNTHPALAWLIAAPSGVVGGALMLVGLVAMGVRMGIRAAEAERQHR